ncbi:MAG TPA: hypothetical protein VL400_14730, partial [Polyangiaceae bacterium]|nr:hypothetical protein [Polyangiaceae bacterium]
MNRRIRALCRGLITLAVIGPAARALADDAAPAEQRPEDDEAAQRDAAAPPPADTGAASTEDAPSQASVEPEPPPSSPLDVTVAGVKKPPSVSSLTRAEVRALPGAFGDPFRAIEILPGVTPIVSGLPFFYVRGAPPG